MQKCLLTRITGTICFRRKIATYNQEVLNEGREKHKLIILLAGRPYHSDPLIQHKVSDMIAAMGVYVITDDIVRQQEISLEKLITSLNGHLPTVF